MDCPSAIPGLTFLPPCVSLQISISVKSIQSLFYSVYSGGLLEPLGVNDGACWKCSIVILLCSWELMLLLWSDHHTIIFQLNSDLVSVVDKAFRVLGGGEAVGQPVNMWVCRARQESWGFNVTSIWGMGTAFCKYPSWALVEQKMHLVVFHVWCFGFCFPSFCMWVPQLRQKRAIKS